MSKFTLSLGYIWGNGDAKPCAIWGNGVAKPCAEINFPWGNGVSKPYVCL